jgi:hypothetical protein
MSGEERVWVWVWVWVWAWVWVWVSVQVLCGVVYILYMWYIYTKYLYIIEAVHLDKRAYLSVLR